MTTEMTVTKAAIGNGGSDLSVVLGNSEMLRFC